jgi:hypothetical protein
VAWEELADYAVPRFDGWPRELHESLFPATTPTGRSIPGVRIPVGERNFLELAHRIARQEFVFPTVASVAPFLAMGHYDFACVPLTGMLPSRSALVWRRHARDPKLREFIRTARRVLQSV